MKILPPYSSSVTWKDFEIDTPTFELTPVEKPDMSPYLVHMTGKDAITSILKAEGLSTTNKTGKGFLKAQIPEQSKGNYFAKVVCFTESPTFALDFFRYRVFRRWKQDLRFGIGFAKARLVECGVSPAVYLSAEQTQRLVGLREKLDEEDDDKDLNSSLSQLKRFFESLYPFCAPLLGAHENQGFSWEREWRYAGSAGFEFDHSDIRVICCPDEEREAIRDVLKDSHHQITFVRSWVEFSDVRDYLERQKNVWATTNQLADKKEEANEQLKKMLHSKRLALHTLEGYSASLHRGESEIQECVATMAAIQEEVRELEKQIKALSKPIKA